MSAIPVSAFLVLGTPALALALAFFLFHRRLARRTHWPILASCAVVTLAAADLALRAWRGEAWDQTLFTWIVGGPWSVEFGIRIDALCVSVLAMVAVVGTLIHVYAVGYMAHDPGFSRFFLYFHLFFFSMIGLLVSNNYLQLYLFWEGVGLASYLLIGFWYERASARAAALKAFLTNRIGDACFLAAVLLLLAQFGTVQFSELFERVASRPVSDPWLAWACGLLFLGAAAKSAQFPLHVWLPDAMEGPTPTSALMHAATMVTAGVFLMARSGPLLEKAPEVLGLIAWIGAGTALGSAIVAAMKKDLKRILAYSTVSHLGLMMMAIGVGHAFAAVAHLVMHGFFKALLFLCAGNVLHALGRSTATVDEVGGLARRMPLTAACFAVGALALAGIPPLSGFFSKDLVLEAVDGRGDRLLMGAALAVAVGSSLYIFRMFWLAFFGDRPRQGGPRAQLHENGAWMQIPVLLLALLSFGAGAAAWGVGLLPAELSGHTAGLGLSAAAAGLALSCLLFMAWPQWDWNWRERWPGLERWMDADFGWQTFAHRVVAAPAAAFARFVAWNWDRRVLDRFLESSAETCLGLSEGMSSLSRGMLNDYLWWMAAGAACLAGCVLWAF